MRVGKFMPLIKCPECDSDVSSAAAACPRCGYPIKKFIDDTALKLYNLYKVSTENRNYRDPSNPVHKEFVMKVLESNEDIFTAEQKKALAYAYDTAAQRFEYGRFIERNLDNATALYIKAIKCFNDCFTSHAHLLWMAITIGKDTNEWELMNMSLGLAIDALQSMNPKSETSISYAQTIASAIGKAYATKEYPGHDYKLAVYYWNKAIDLGNKYVLDYFKDLPEPYRSRKINVTGQILWTKIIEISSQQQNMKAIKRGVVGGLLLGGFGMLAGIYSTPEKQMVTFAVKYKDGKEESETVKAGSPRFNFLYSFCIGEE